MGGVKFPPFFLGNLMCPPANLVPFDRSLHASRDFGYKELTTGYRTQSTEIINTYSLEDEKYGNEFAVNVPSVWWDEHGNSLELDSPLETALKYEKQTGMKFPRFGSIESAVKAAVARSRQGGAQKRPLIDLHSVPYQGYSRGKK